MRQRGCRASRPRSRVGHCEPSPNASQQPARPESTSTGPSDIHPCAGGDPTEELRAALSSASGMTRSLKCGMAAKPQVGFWDARPPLQGPVVRPSHDFARRGSPKKPIDGVGSDRTDSYVAKRGENDDADLRRTISSPARASSIQATRYAKATRRSRTRGQGQDAGGAGGSRQRWPASLSGRLGGQASVPLWSWAAVTPDPGLSMPMSPIPHSSLTSQSSRTWRPQCAQTKSWISCARISLRNNVG